LRRPLKWRSWEPKRCVGEDGAEKNEVKFNYSTDEPARALTDWFERMAESARYNADLERAVKYDKTGRGERSYQIESALRDKAPRRWRAVPADAGPRYQQRILHAHRARRATALAAAIPGAKK